MKHCQLLCEICGGLLDETYMSEIDGNWGTSSELRWALKKMFLCCCLCFLEFTFQGHKWSLQWRGENTPYFLMCHLQKGTSLDRAFYLLQGTLCSPSSLFSLLSSLKLRPGSVVPAAPLSLLGLADPLSVASSGGFWLHSTVFLIFWLTKIPNLCSLWIWVI